MPASIASPDRWSSNSRARRLAAPPLVPRLPPDRARLTTRMRCRVFRLTSTLRGSVSMVTTSLPTATMCPMNLRWPASMATVSPWAISSRATSAMSRRMAAETAASRSASSASRRSSERIAAATSSRSPCIPMTPQMPHIGVATVARIPQEIRSCHLCVKTSNNRGSSHKEASQWGLADPQTGGGGPVLLARVVGGTYQRAGLDPGEAQLLADAAVLGKLVGMDPAVHRHVVVGGGRKVLADGHQVHTGSPEVAEGLHDLLEGLAHADDDVRLRGDPGLELLCLA